MEISSGSKFKIINISNLHVQFSWNSEVYYFTTNYLLSRDCIAVDYSIWLIRVNVYHQHIDFKLYWDDGLLFTQGEAY